MKNIRTLAILTFDDVEVLDFCGPFEIFSVANRDLDLLDLLSNRMMKQSDI